MNPVEKLNSTKYDCLLFDMDDTLYPLSSGLNLACRRNIQEYMLQHLQIEESQVPKMCLDLYKEYGTTMAGLKVLGYEFDNDEFHQYIHGRLPYETLKPDPVLRNLLLSMPQRKIIFTNADKAHVAQVLSRLGLEDCFQGVICFETLNPFYQSLSDNDDKEMDQIDNSFFSESETETENGEDCENAGCYFASSSQILCKPSLKAIHAAMRVADIDPQRTIFFDDSARNIVAGKAAGLHTVLVGSSVLIPGADFALSSIHNIKEALPEIWEYDEKEIPLEQVHSTTAVETVVLA